MAIGITVAGSVVIGSGVGIPFDNIAATAVTGTKTIITGASQNFSTIDVAYGMAPITYSISPSLSITGLTFNTGNGNITGTATSTTAGISYSVTATDQYSRSASASFTLVVELGFSTTLVISSRTVTAGVNETGFVPVTAQGGTAPVTFGISPTIVGLGLTFNNSNGAISGNATSTISATSYRITATDATSQSSFKDFTMTVAAPAFAATLSIASRTLTAGTADSFTPVTVTSGSTGYGTKVWSLTSSPALPSGLTLNSTNGLISGTPTITRASTSYTIRITDGLGQTASQTFSMTVAAPALTTTLVISSRVMQVDTADSFTPVTASGGYSTLTWSISPALPSGLSLDTSNGLISGTSTRGISSTSYTVTVTDGLSQTSNKSFTLSILYTAGYTVADVDPYAYILAPAGYIDPQGALFTWGSGASGGLGTGTTLSRSLPTQIATASWVAVAGIGDTDYAWAIRSDGTLWTWGNNNNGQLAQGDTINRSNPTQVGSATNWTYVAVQSNGNNGCAINSSGQLWVAGSNSIGALGDNTTINRSSLTQISGSWTQVMVGTQSLGIDSNYNLYAWGYNNNGQLGTNNIVDRSSPVLIDAGNQYIQVSMGNQFVFAMRDDFTIWAWGSNTAVGNLAGALGLGDTNNRSTPTQIGTSSWIMVKAHGNGGVAIKNDNTLWSWGSNLGGTLGINLTGTVNARSSPTQIGSGTWKNVTTNGTLTAIRAVNNLDQLFGWGSNNNGQIGDGTTLGRSSPVQVSIGSLIPTSASQVIGGTGVTTFFIKTQNNDYSLWGAGYAATGNLGQGDTVQRSNVVQVGGGLLDQWYAVSNTEGNYTAAIKSNGTLWAWGLNSSGQLGTNDTFNRSYPTQITTSSNWTIIGDLGGGGMGAINSLGQLFVWGSGANGSLGLNSTISRSSPTQLAGSWKSISAGGNTTFAISDTFKLFSWGFRGSSNLGLGDGSTFNRSSPVQVGTSSWIQVAGGSNFAMALRSDGRLFTWGDGTFGVLGLNDTLGRSVPTQVGTSTWTMIDTAGTFAAAIRSNGSLFTWGQGNGGRLGLGASDTFSRSSPTQVGTSSWTNIGIGESASMAITTTNQIFGWGLNGRSQLGTGDTIARSSPTLVHSGGTPTLEYLLVGGGGGGGGNRGGGGGAGGYVDGIGYTVVLGDTITVAVGAAGAASDANSNGGDGGNSSISSAYGGTVTAYGGGGGGNNFTATGGNSINGDNGGSGGGGGMTNASSGAGVGGKGVYPGSTYISAARQGFDGGAGSTNDTNAGGGGGALRIGGNATNSVGGNGGAGKQWHDGVTYAGGGGGGADSGGTGGTGGAGGGGNGVTGSTAAVAGGTNTGGGGGGGGANSTSGAAGGTGIVILRYPSVYPVATATTGTPTVTTSNGYRYYKFTGATGSITF